MSDADDSLNEIFDCIQSEVKKSKHKALKHVTLDRLVRNSDSIYFQASFDYGPNTISHEFHKNLSISIWFKARQTKPDSYQAHDWQTIPNDCFAVEIVDQGTKALVENYYSARSSKKTFQGILDLLLAQYILLCSSKEGNRKSRNALALGSIVLLSSMIAYSGLEVPSCVEDPGYFQRNLLIFGTIWLLTLGATFLRARQIDRHYRGTIFWYFTLSIVASLYPFMFFFGGSCN